MKKHLEKSGIFILKNLVFFYKKAISLYYIGKNCRYVPTCSTYMLEVLEIHGFFKGFFLGIKRILGCHPWGKKGFDPSSNTLKQIKK
jgi:uncharacterized protein